MLTFHKSDFKYVKKINYLEFCQLHNPSPSSQIIDIQLPFMPRIYPVDLDSPKHTLKIVMLLAQLTFQWNNIVRNQFEFPLSAAILAADLGVMKITSNLTWRSYVNVSV